MDTTEIQRIRRDYYKQLYANKMDNLQEMDKFLETIIFPGENRKYKHTNHKHWNGNCDFKTPNKPNEFEQAPGAGDGQGSLVCCSLWGHKESDMPERLNWTEQNKPQSGARLLHRQILSDI